MALRETVWLALSDLFLDTDTSLFREKLIEVLLQSPFDMATLDRIFIDEVYPVCIFNLEIVVGEWAMFHEEWLFSEIEAHRAKWQPLLMVQRTKRMANARVMVPEWFVIRERLLASGKQ